MKNQKVFKAFSLLNTMIAILIAGILTALAVPEIMKNVTKAKKAEAKTQLEHLYSLERLHFLEFSKYSPDLEAIDFEQQTLVTEDGGARYKIEIVDAGTTNFTGRATAVQDFDGDGVFNVWEINQDRKVTETVKD